jgi:hypothetical protein
MGIKTGIDVGALLEVARYFQRVTPDIHFSSSILEAGLPNCLGKITKDGTEQKWS